MRSPYSSLLTYLLHLHLALFRFSAYPGTIKLPSSLKVLAMNVQLVIMRNRKRVWAAQLHHTEATLGRARGCTIRIPSAQVSRLHCRLRMENGVVTVEDLESVNGTFVNGKRIHEPEIIHPGDHLSIGPVTFVVEYELSTTTLRPLSDEEAFQARETASDVELVEEAKLHPETQPPLVTEAEVEVADKPSSKIATKPPPTGELLEVVEEQTDVETVPFAEQDEIHISDSGTLRDFLIELDESDKHSSEHS
jgi:predicted component of type VI protein secretion system